jgi:hypothetical protein
MRNGIWKHYYIKVYTIENCEYGYNLSSSDVNRPREHAKRILTEGYWEKEDDYTETFHAPWRIVKVKVKEV